MHFNVDSAARYEFLLRSCFSWRRNRDQAPPSRSLIHCTVEYSPWIDWGLTALSAQMGYIVPSRAVMVRTYTVRILEDGAGTSNIFKRIFLKPSIWFYTSYYMTILRSVSMYPDCPIVGQQRYKVADFRSETRYQDFPVFSVFWATHNVWR